MIEAATWALRLVCEIVGGAVLLFLAYLLTVYTVHKYGKRVGFFFYSDYAELGNLLIIWRDPFFVPIADEKHTIRELRSTTDWKSIKLFGVTFMWVSRNVRK